MPASTSSETQDARHQTRGLAVALTFVLAVLPCVARAQTAVDQRVGYRVDQGGRLFDANPTVGGSRYNYAQRPVSPLIGGNAYATGLMRQGLSLHINNPIPATTSFRASLPSGMLSSFRRDSVSVADVGVLSPSRFTQPYYDPGTTVGTTGFLAGLVGVGTSPQQHPMDFRIQTPLDLQGGLRSQIVGLSMPTPALQPETTSSIFGLKPPPRVPIPEVEEYPWLRFMRSRAAVEQSEGLEPAERDQADPEGWPREEGAPLTPLEMVLRAELEPPVGVLTGDEERPTWSGRTGEDPLTPRVLTSPEEPTAGTPALLRPQITDPTILPYYDKFNDLRMAVALSENPDAEWFEDIRTALRDQPGLAQELPEEVFVDAQADATVFVARVLDAPLTTFIGSGPSGVNNELLKAETLMDIGHYQEADDHYKMAHLLDPANPLPLIGRGHALLAAGHYRSAAFALIQGLERFPEMARFAVDVKRLMGGGEIIDIRRADMMDRLAQREAPELRFMLGYLEYHSGDRERGMANLERAAANPLAGMLVARYPALLRGEGVIPPPKSAPEPIPEPDVKPDLPLPGAPGPTTRESLDSPAAPAPQDTSRQESP